MRTSKGLLEAPLAPIPEVESELPDANDKDEPLQKSVRGTTWITNKLIELATNRITNKTGKGIAKVLLRLLQGLLELASALLVVPNLILDMVDIVADIVQWVKEARGSRSGGGGP